MTAMMLLATVVALLYGTGRLASGTIALVSVAPFVSSLVLLPRTQSGPSLFNRLVDQPARLLVATFAALCIVGGLGVALPWCSSSGATVGVLDAFFTAVSASCVTGLMVLDVSKDLSLGGQLLVLGLIQAGGLGIMTISSAAMALLGRRLSLHQEQVMAQLVSEKNRADLYSALTRTVIVTGACELAGAIGLTAAFWHAGDSLGKAVWRAVFTSISAFCNAGISLQSDNLVGYQTSPAVLYIVSALIIAGGLSPAVIVVIPKWIRGQRTSVQARISLVGTAALLVIGLLLIALVEWSASLAALAWDDRLHNAWFQSVTLRTAGFNSIDFAALRPATWMVMIALMFVGGCPGSTAGGIKVTTAVVLLLSVVGSLRGRNAAQAYGRKISQATVFKAASIVTVGGLAVVLVTTLLLITQPIPFESAMFEVVSAFGTVGVSLGATTQLDEIGKIIIITCMFLGRVGPLSVFLVLSDRNHPDSWSLPQEEINVG